ncbi:glycosyltransferase family 4 protein [Candidatus Pacearchaeota archaeon]|nr:glycosyltransferase family 4 protein [Candidatus Pacearchaeota archaeon]
MRKVQFYPYIDQIHTSYKSLIEQPPAGYTFIGVPRSERSRWIDGLRKYSILRKAYKVFLRLFNTTKIVEYSFQGPSMHEADIVYSFGTFYKGTKPFVVDLLDSPYSLAGNNYHLFIRNRMNIEKYLAAENCKYVICTHDTSLEFMKKHFSKEVQKKLVLIPQAVKPISFKKSKSPRFRALFMGSINNPDDFYLKGGLEAIYAFQALGKENAELIVRCKVPESVKNLVRKSNNITLLDEILPFDKVIELYTSSDMLLMPSHQYVLMATLESLYFGLPIVALDTYAVKDFVKDGYNGFLVKPSSQILAYKDPIYPTNLRSAEFISEIRAPDPILISNLADRIRTLIKNSKLRKKMGDNARKLATTVFSIEERNKKLKNIFDTMISS